MRADRPPRWQRLGMLSAEALARAERTGLGERRIWRELARWAILQCARFVLLERRP